MDKEHSEFLALFFKKEELKEQLKEIETKIKEKEEYYLEQVNNGKQFDWCWKYQFKRTTVSWKDKFIEYNGKKEADLILAKTEETVYDHIAVDGFHNKAKQKPVEVKRKLPIKKLKK